MMFDKIAVGDTVLTVNSINVIGSGWQVVNKAFLEPATVVSVTKTQLKIEDGRRYTRDRGGKYGGTGQAYPVGYISERGSPFDRQPKAATDPAVIQGYRDMQKAVVNFFAVYEKLYRRRYELIKHIVLTDEAAAARIDEATSHMSALLALDADKK